jgi:hypothetical protein
VGLKTSPSPPKAKKDGAKEEFRNSKTRMVKGFFKMAENGVS